jgi:HEAT repeat protein
MVSLLRIMDRTDAVPLLREILGHRHFYVRWHAMREFLALDAEAALPSLRAMARSDPHPEVRAAAAQALSACFADDPDRTEKEFESCHA